MRILPLLLLAASLAGVCRAQDGIRDKALRKECKKTLKLMRKGGWDVYASAQTLGDAVTRYYSLMENEGRTAVIVVGHGRRKSAQLAQREANAMALGETAGMIESEVAGATSVVMENLNSGKDVRSGLHSSNRVDVRVHQKLKGMRPSLQVCRKVKTEDGQEMAEVQVFYLIKDGEL